MRNPVQKMLKAGSQMKNNPALAKREEQSPNPINSFAAKMVIPEQQAMQKSKPIPYPVGSVLMQKLAQAQQAALAAQQPSPREGGIAQVAAKGGVLKFAKGKKVKDPLPEDLITSEENTIRNLGEQLEQGRRDLRNERNQKAELGLGKEPAEQKKMTSQERKVKTALQKQDVRMDRNAAAIDKAVAKAQKGIADEAATKRATQATERQKLRGMGRTLEEQAKTPSGKVPQSQKPIGRGAGPDYRAQGIEQAAGKKALAEKAEKTIGSGLQNPAERGAGSGKKAPAYDISSYGGRARPQGPAPQQHTPMDKEKALEQRKADRYKASEAAEKDGAEPKKVSKEAESYRKERLGSEARVAEAQQKGASFEEAGLGKSRTSMPGAKAAKAASPASFMDNLTGSVKSFFSKNPDMMANARQVAQDVLAKNPEATMDEIGAAIKKSATPEAIRAMEAEIAPTLEKHGMRDFFSRAAGGISGMAKAAPGALGTAAVMYPVAAGIKDVLDENFDAQNKFNRGLRDVGNAIIPAAQADEPADADIQRLEKMGRGEMSIADIAGAPPAQAPAPQAAPPAPAPQAPQGVAQAAPAAPAAPQGGIAAAPQAPAPKQDIYAGDTSEGTPQSAISELMGLQGPGYQYSPEVMGMLKDAKDEERGNTLLKMIGMTGAGLANRNRYEGAHDAALLATQAFTSGTEREDEAQKQFLQGIIHNEQVPFEQRAKAYNDYVSMQKSKATNEALMARAGLSAEARRYAADQSLAGKAYGGGSGQNQQYKAMHNKAVMYKQLAHEVAMSDPDKAQEYLALAEQYETQAGGLAGLAGDEGLGQTTTPRLTLDAFK